MLFSTSVISTRRLDLILLSPEFLRLSIDGDHEGAERLLGLTIPLDWYENRALIEIRIGQLCNDPEYYPWCLRGIGLREQHVVVGYIGFHTKPGTAYLQNYAASGVEYGYAVFPPYRRRGFAREACEGLMKWAYDVEGVSEFVVSISPENLASRRLAESFGFVKVGSHMDEVDGLEEIFKLEYKQENNEAHNI